MASNKTFHSVTQSLRSTFRDKFLFTLTMTQRFVCFKIRNECLQKNLDQWPWQSHSHPGKIISRQRSLTFPHFLPPGWLTGPSPEWCSNVKLTSNIPISAGLSLLSTPPTTTSSIWHHSSQHNNTITTIRTRMIIITHQSPLCWQEGGKSAVRAGTISWWSRPQNNQSSFQWLIACIEC